MHRFFRPCRTAASSLFPISCSSVSGGREASPCRLRLNVLRPSPLKENSTALIGASAPTASAILSTQLLSPKARQDGCAKRSEEQSRHLGLPHCMRALDESTAQRSANYFDFYNVFSSLMGCRSIFRPPNSLPGNADQNTQKMLLQAFRKARSARRSATRRTAAAGEVVFAQTSSAGCSQRRKSTR